ncbi:MAG: ATP-binding protein, partial [Bdellovibrionota bacterium]
VDAARIRDRLKDKFPQLDVSGETDEEVIQHLFDPGFSTAAKVTAYSGRGAGLDAVKAAAKALGGDIRVTSVVGKGTRFTIRVPRIQDIN